MGLRKGNYNKLSVHHPVGI